MGIEAGMVIYEYIRQILLEKDPDTFTRLKIASTAMTGEGGRHGKRVGAMNVTVKAGTKLLNSVSFKVQPNYIRIKWKTDQLTEPDAEKGITFGVFKVPDLKDMRKRYNRYRS